MSRTDPTFESPARLRVEMTSDWHVGAGVGRPGDVDRLVARDRDGLPFVPGKTLTGMVRDAAERLVAALPPAWAPWLDHLFGSQPARGEGPPSGAPRPAAVSIRAARYPESLRRSLAARGVEERDALTFVRPGVAIDAATDAARGKQFRTVEYARRGSVLHATLTFRDLDATPIQRAAASALVVASLRLVERLGGRRRRGGGRCSVTVSGVDAATAIDWIEAHLDSPPAPPPPPASAPLSSAAPDASAPPPADDPWVDVPFVLELELPVAIPVRRVGNVTETLDFVPGTYLLPHLTRVLAALDPHAPTHVRRGDVRVSPATIEIDGTPGAPAPRCLAVVKESAGFAARGGVVNRLAGAPFGEPLKAVRGGFVGAAAPDRLPRHEATAVTTRTHNVVEDRAQRPNAEVGGVYTYEAISDRHRLRGTISVRGALADRLPDGWWERIGGRLAVGGSEKDDYGAVRLRPERPRHRDVGSASDIEEGGTFVVWLRSDLLVRNDRLVYDATVDAVRHALGRVLWADVPEAAGDLIVEEAYVETRRLDSWHRRWNRPRPSILAMAGGSVIRFRTERRIPGAALASLRHEGLGERRAEGYGAVEIDPPWLLGDLDGRDPAPDAESVDAEGGETAPPRVGADDEGADFARLLERVIVRRRVERRARERAAQLGTRELLGMKKGGPSLSQWGTIRQLLRGVRSPEDERVGAYLARSAEKSVKRESRARSWEATGELRRLLIESDRVWEALAPLPLPGLVEPSVGGGDVKRTEWGFAVETLLDACLRAHRRASEEHRRGAPALRDEEG